MSDPGWRGKPDYMHYKANYLLIVDNLSDFAHLAFVHTRTLGGSEEYAYKSKPTAIERLPDGFRVERWHMNADSAVSQEGGATRASSTAATSRACTCPASSSWRHCFARPAGGRRERQPAGREAVSQLPVLHAGDQRSTHFFWDYLHDYELQDPTIALSLNNSMIEGFLEDKFIIEGQQEMLDADADFKMNAIVADAPLAHFRRTLAKLIDAERGSRRGRLTNSGSG